MIRSLLTVAILLASTSSASAAFTFRWNTFSEVGLNPGDSYEFTFFAQSDLVGPATEALTVDAFTPASNNGDFTLSGINFCRPNNYQCEL